MSASGLCAICADVAPGEIRALDARQLFICDRCETAPAREYRFDGGNRGGASVVPVGNGQVHGRGRSR